MKSPSYLVYLGDALRIDLCKCTKCIKQDSLKSDKSTKE